MSNNLTEEASKLRSNAAASVIKNQFAFNEIKRNFAAFKIESTTSQDLANKEKITLTSFNDGNKTLLDNDVKNTIESTAKAVSASLFPSNSVIKITSLFNELDNVHSSYKQAQAKLLEFNIALDFNTNKNILLAAQNIIRMSIERIKNVLNLLHQLLFS